MKGCSDADTMFYIFCSTHNKDANWKEIKKWIQENDINAHFFTSIEEDKINVLELLITDMQKEESEEEKEPEKEEEDQICKFTEDEDHITVVIKKRKPKKIAPKIMFIFDDFSSELKDGNITKLLKEHRHFKSKVIISSQYPNDLAPAGRSQIDYWLLYQGHSEAKLEEIFGFLNLDIPFEKFKELYHNATKEKYNFLYIDRNDETFRKNFDMKYVI
jgi:hypothetical protein